ncbi:hypothetical protein GCM10018966_049500 [Streptomyces yanii]
MMTGGLAATAGPESESAPAPSPAVWGPLSSMASSPSRIANRSVKLLIAGRLQVSHIDLPVGNKVLSPGKPLPAPLVELLMWSIQR